MGLCMDSQAHWNGVWEEACGNVTVYMGFVRAGCNDAGD
jgi:hypothetical protein